MHGRSSECRSSGRRIVDRGPVLRNRNTSPIGGWCVECGCSGIPRLLRSVLIVLPILLLLASERLAGVASAQPPAEKKSSARALDAFNAAANLLNNGAFDLASEEWSAFLKAFPDDPLAGRARYYLGYCQMQLKQYAEAEKTLAEAVKNDKFDLLEEALLHLGFCRFALAENGAKEKYREAAATFQRQLKRFPKGKRADQALYYQGEAWYALGEFGRAAKTYEALLKFVPKSPLRCDALYAWGTALEEIKAWPQALKAYDQFLESCADHRDRDDVLARKGDVLLALQKFQDAENIFAELAAQEGYPAADFAQFQRAFCLYRLGKPAEAATTYESLPRRFPESVYAVRARLFAGKAWYQAKQYERAAAVLKMVATSNAEERFEATHWLAQAYLKQGDAKAALEALDRLPKVPQDSSWSDRLALDRADCLLALGKLEEAARYFQRVASRGTTPSNRAIGRYNVAYVKLKQKKYDEAIVQAQKFLQAHAAHELKVDTQIVLAESQLAAGKPEQAAKIYAELIAEGAQDSEAFSFPLRRAAALLAAKKPDEVVAELSPRVEQWQGAAAAEARFLIGVARFSQGKYAEAAASLRASVLADAGWERIDEAMLYLARAEHRAGNTAQAITHLETLIKEHPDSKSIVSAFFRLGEFQYAAGSYERAIAAYEEVLKRSKQGVLRPFALSGKGWSLVKLGRHADADKVLTELIDGSPASPVRSGAFLARGLCRRHLEKWAEAIADLDHYLTHAPQDAARADALYEKGLALAGLKKYQEAAATFRQILDAFPKYGGRDRVLFELAWAEKERGAENSTATFARLATEHPKSPYAAEAWFQVGEARYEKKAYGEAANAYARALAAKPNAELEELVRYKLGFARYHMKQYAEAAEQFRRQLERFPEGKLVGDAAFMLGETYFKLKKYAEAYEQFVAAQRHGARTPQIEALILLHGAQSAGQLEKWDASRSWLETFLEKHAASPLAVEARYELGRAFKELGRTDSAVEAWREVVRASRSVLAVQAQFMLGEVAFEKKDFDEAVKAFRLAMFRYGAERAPPEYHPWQARAAFEAARCHEVRIRTATRATQRVRHLQEARRFYQHVVEKYPKSELVKAARKRLAALAQLQ